MIPLWATVAWSAFVAVGSFWVGATMSLNEARPWRWNEVKRRRGER